MNNRTAFGRVIGSCDNCGGLIYEYSTYYLVRILATPLCLCERCVTVVDPSADGDSEATDDGE